MYCLFYNKSLVQSKTAAVFYTKSQEQSANKTEQPRCFTKDYTNISILVELALSVALTPSFQKVTRVWSSRERNNLLNLKRLHCTQYILNRYDLIFIQKNAYQLFLTCVCEDSLTPSTLQSRTPRHVFNEDLSLWWKGSHQSHTIIVGKQVFIVWDKMIEIRTWQSGKMFLKVKKKF